MPDHRDPAVVRSEMERYDSLGPLSREAFSYLVPEVGISRVLAAAPGN